MRSGVITLVWRWGKRVDSYFLYHLKFRCAKRNNKCTLPWVFQGALYYGAQYAVTARFMLQRPPEQ